MKETATTDLVPQEIIESKIYIIRGKKVMLDKDLALLYQVETRALKQAVRRNIERFPAEFMLKLSMQEVERLVSHFVIPSKQSLGGHLPYAFTEQGVAMLSSVLKSKRAIQVNIQIMKTFIRLKEMILGYKELKQKIEEIEQKYDSQFKIVFDTIKQLLEPETKSKRKIGFYIGEGNK